MNNDQYRLNLAKLCKSFITKTEEAEQREFDIVEKKVNEILRAKLLYEIYEISQPFNMTKLSFIEIKDLIELFIELTESAYHEIYTAFDPGPEQSIEFNIKPTISRVFRKIIKHAHWTVEEVFLAHLNELNMLTLPYLPEGSRTYWFEENGIDTTAEDKLARHCKRDTYTDIKKDVYDTIQIVDGLANTVFNMRYITPLFGKNAQPRVDAVSSEAAIKILANAGWTVGEMFEEVTSELAVVLPKPNGLAAIRYRLSVGKVADAIKVVLQPIIEA